MSHPLRASPLVRPAPVIRHEDGAEIFEVKAILEARGTGSKRQYLVEWEGYPLWEATWQSASDIAGARDALEQFEESRL